MEKKIIRSNEIIIIMPLFNGSLSSELKKRNSLFPPIEIAKIFKEIVDGIYYLHSFGEKGIAHRDLKVIYITLLF